MTSAATILNDNEKESIDMRQQLREVMSGVCTPVSVVTALEGSVPFGSTVSAFTSLSLDPPMVLVALDRTSETLAAIRASGTFGLNVLAAAQSGLAMQFAKKATDKWRDVLWHDEAGVPRIEGASGWIRCAVHDLLDGGDHIIVNGLVKAASQTPETSPLTYHRRRFGTHAELD